MKPNPGSILPRGRDRQHGQALVLAIVVLTGLVAAAALVVDMGNLYICYDELVAATQAAAKAGGGAIATGANPAGIVTNYSGGSGALYNVHPNLNVTSVKPQYGCASIITYPKLGLPPCATYAGVTGSVNAIKVTETAIVPMFFAKFFGVKTIPIAATAIASVSGGGAIPYNIMMVLDTTSSMGSGSDSGCVTGSLTSYSPEQCAQFGIQTLLSELAPCATSLASCGSSPAVDNVGLMVFPGLCSDTGAGVTTASCSNATTLSNTTANPTYAPDDYACPATNPPIASYNNNPEYLVLGFQNNYRLSDTAALNTNSQLFKTVGAGTSNCGLPTPGGKGTFYAGAIYAAKDYLYANHRKIGGTDVQDVMIILSDGDASATAAQMGGTVKTDGLALFDSKNECQQAITAAASAMVAPYNIKIYSISYGSETSGCSTDKKNSYSPCDTMLGMASSPSSQYFFSVPQTVGGTTSTVCTGAVPITQLNQVFTTIAGDLQSSRLVPNGVVFQ